MVVAAHPVRVAAKVARWQNVIPSFPWIAPGWRAWGRNPKKGRDQILPSGNHGRHMDRMSRHHHPLMMRNLRVQSVSVNEHLIRRSTKLASIWCKLCSDFRIKSKDTFLNQGSLITSNCCITCQTSSTFARLLSCVVWFPLAR